MLQPVTFQTIVADSESEKHACKSHLYLQKISSIYWKVILDLVTDNNSIEI